jgi:hypothetical protein
MGNSSCHNPQSRVPPGCRNPQSPVTDSPWFWVLVFAGMALVALVAIGPKYGRRQAGLERQYQARERIADDSVENDQPTAARSEPAERRAFASASNTLVPLWPLALVISAVMVFAAIMLFRAQRRPPSREQVNPA